MLFFGYIVTDIRYSDLKEDIISVVSSVSECVRPIPKMIIGLENAKKYANESGFEFDILEHTFPNGDMWTFKKTEKREFYEEDIEAFKKRIVEIQGCDVSYYYVNIYSLKYGKLKKLYNILFRNLLKKVTNYIITDGDMFYFCIDEKTVVGVSFLHLKYIGIQREKIISKLRQCRNNKVYFTSSKNMWKLKEWFCGREYVIASIFESNAQKQI